jgi:hypothetical protein
VDAAEARYLELARGLGWQEGVKAEAAAPAAAEPADEDDIWDPPDYQHQSASGGMANAVSMVAADDEVLPADERPLHALALAGDADALGRFLDANPATDVNEPDEFVSARSRAARTRMTRVARDTRPCTSRATAGTPPSSRCCSRAARTGRYGCGAHACAQPHRH